MEISSLELVFGLFQGLGLLCLCIFCMGLEVVFCQSYVELL